MKIGLLFRIPVLLLGGLLFLGEAANGTDRGIPDAHDPMAGRGVNIHFTDPRPGELEMLSAAGFQWVRMDLNWEKSESISGKYDFAPWDRLLAHLDKFHIRAVLILDNANKLYDQGLPPHSEVGRAAFTRWAVSAVKHFQGRGVLWEIWNEPNGDWFWKPHANAKDYVKLAVEVTDAINKAAPEELVVGPAVFGQPAARGAGFDFIEACGKAGLFKKWSLLTVHPYFREGPESYGRSYDRIRKILAHYQSSRNPTSLGCGESGYSSTWVDEKTQAAYLARLFLDDTLQDIPLTIWYDWHDDGTNLKDQEHNFGTVHYAYHEGENPVYEAKPAYFAAKTYADELRGYRFQERLKSAPDDYLLSFVRPGKVRWVAWTAGAPHTIKLPLDGVYETMKEDGKPGPLLKADQGTTKILLNGFPQYFWKK